MPLWGPQTPPGPARWERARRNAELRPNSHGAKLYAWRNAVADEVSRRLHEKWHNLRDHVWCTERHMLRYYRDPVPVRREYFCSERHMLLKLQLDTNDKVDCDTYYGAMDAVHSKSYDKFGIVREDEHQRLLVKLPDHDRPVRCRVCDVTIMPSGELVETEAKQDAATVNAIVAATEAVTAYVLLDGEFVPLSELRVVDLTERDHELFSKYSTPVLRHKYVTDHGRRFDA